MSKYGNPEILISDVWDKYKLSIRPNPALDEKILASAMDAYSSSYQDNSAAVSDSPQKSPRLFSLLKWASIPVITAALLLLLNPFAGSSVAWGRVMERVDQSPTTIVRGESFLRGEDHELKHIEIGAVGYISKEFGSHFYITEFGKTVFEGFTSPDGKLFTKIDSRTGERKQLSMLMLGPGLFSDPKLLIRDFLSHPYVKIGRKAMNGIKVEGIEIPINLPGKDQKRYAGEKDYMRLWVDIKTGLPVREEHQISLAAGEAVWILDFQWNIPLPQSIFQIPDQKKDPEKK
jgi:hypothetical protein